MVSSMKKSLCCLAILSVILLGANHVTAQILFDDDAVSFTTLSGLSVSGAVYDSSRGLIYASTPASLGINGNSLAIIDPATEEVEFINGLGSNPVELEISEDNSVVYIGINGAQGFRSFDPETRTLGNLVQFEFGGVLGNQPVSARDFAIRPDDPSVVVVSVGNGELRVFDETGRIGGTLNARSSLLSESIGFIDANTLFGIDDIRDNTLRFNLTDSIDGLDLDFDTSRSGLVGRNSDQFQFAGGLIFGEGGEVIDPSTLSLLGEFDIFGAIEPVVSEGITYGLQGDQLSIFSNELFLQSDSISLGLPFETRNGTGDLFVAGENTLAFIGVDDQLSLIRGVPATGISSVPDTSEQSFFENAQVERDVLDVQDAVYDSSRDLVYATIPASAGFGFPNGNSLAVLDPVALEVTDFFAVGSDPNVLSISDDNSLVYIGIDGANAIRSFDLETNTLNPLISLLGNVDVVDIAVRPGTPSSAAVAVRNTGISGSQTTLFINGQDIAVNNRSSFDESIDFLDSNTLVGFETFITTPDLSFYEFDGPLLSDPSVTSERNIVAPLSNIEVSNDLVFGTDGSVFDTLTRTRIAELGNVRAVEVVPAEGLVYTLGDGVLSAFDLEDFTLIDTFDTGLTQSFGIGRDDLSLFVAGEDRLGVVTDSGNLSFITGIPVSVASTPLLGDVNLDGVVDFFDIAPFIEVLSAQGFLAEADVDQSGAVDFLDIAPFIAVLSD